ncbi:SURF1 family protein [Xinfangfangia sp. CPCC 101601]|uniref:SURF1-like protein n=1 Tax=Pseudogemmobacter lacusdianii TaxID=3069608 RepID=A0ABU0VVQ9_9RHOB|nr:SURF1 family protein [Xinfangfangia sp. CPCC 101601]MDQ2065824.1 SURF1 family protein [Xinfangfangia sp. CPCC 101601]
MLFPFVMGIVGCAILISLGVWQLGRAEWKEGVLAQIDARIAAAPATLSAELTEAEHEYLAVSVAGRFTGAFVELLAGQKGTGPGVRIIEAFETDTGRRILIDRGFLEDAARKTPRTAAAATVTGNLLWPDDDDSYTPPPDAKTGLWFERDLPAMAAKLGSEEILIVASQPTGDAITPVPVDSSSVPNSHMGYAIQWFLLALVWGVMTLYLLWRIRQRTV